MRTTLRNALALAAVVLGLGVFYCPVVQAGQVHQFSPNHETKEGQAVAALWKQYGAATKKNNSKLQLELSEKVLQIKPASDKALFEIRFYRTTAYYNVACAQALLGDKEKAFVSLKTAVAMGYDEVAHMKQDIDLVSLRSDKRFTDACDEAEKIGKQPRTLCGTLVANPFASNNNDKEYAWLLRITAVAGDSTTEKIVHIFPDSMDTTKDAAILAKRKEFWKKLDTFAVKKTPVVVEGSGATDSTHNQFIVTNIKAADIKAAE